jgi:hypothetical protein
MKAKIALLALGAGFILTSAQAQKSQYDINYPVCKAGGDYVICDKDDAMRSAQKLSSGRSVPAKGYTEPDCKTTVVYVNKSNQANEALTVKYEMPNDEHMALEPECTAALAYPNSTTQYGNNRKVCDNTVVCIKHKKDGVQAIGVVSAKENPRFTASYDMPGDVYEGEDVLSHDGIDKVKQRNLNYLEFGPTKVPNDGGLATRY